MIDFEIFNYERAFLEEIKKMQTMDCPIILFGAGSTATFNLQYLNKIGIRPSAFCDNSLDKIGKSICNLSVLSFHDVKKKYPNAYFYITVQLFYKEIKHQIIQAGYLEEQICQFDIIFQFQWEENCIDYYKRNENAIQELYKNLADEESRKVLENRILFLYHRNRNYLLNIRKLHQYWDSQLIDLKKVKNFIDLGMYTGDTILEFLKRSEENYEQIYGFEPDKHNFSIAKKSLKKYSNIKCICKGTADYNGKISAIKSLGIMKTIEEGIFFDPYQESFFEICTLDKFFEFEKNLKIDMIKMDIEGAELPTLIGAQKIISTQKPIMAICVYHKAEDILQIPIFLSNLEVKYDIYLRHYSDNQTETVCYCIPK